LALHMPCNHNMKTFVLFLVVAAGVRSAAGQALSVGVKGGIPLVDRMSSNDESRPYLVGPSVEIRLPAGLAVEADALYQRIGNTASFGFGSTAILVGSGNNLVSPISLVSPIPQFISRQRGNSWEFPLLGKYYFRPRTSEWQPFVATGYAFRTVGFHDATTETNVDINGALHTLSFKNDYRSSLGVGAVFAAGVRFHTGRFSILPEVRYTRWGSSDNQLRKNEAGLMLGVSF
jgi:hypothetical protein